jgi:hypothetical protein
MARVTTEQRNFLYSLKLPLSTVFDATGMQRTAYQLEMKRDGKLIAIGVTPCAKGGHAMRSRNGHCLQCSTSSLGFLLRHRDPGYVYIAASRKQHLIKVGSTTYLERRAQQLVHFKYGSVDDWLIVASAKFAEAQKVEYEIHDDLRDKKYPATYTRSGKLEETDEIFKVGYSEARKSFARACARNGYTEATERPDAMKNYTF